MASDGSNAVNNKKGKGMINKSLFSSDKMNWCTPKSFYDKLNRIYNFTLDACATDKSAKCPKYFTPETDGLNQSWEGNVVFCNPPYGKDISKWIKKAYDESRKPNTTVVLLIPARTDTKYFHDYIYGKARLRFIKGRLKFEDEEGNTKSSAPFPSMVVVMGLEI